MLQTPKQRFIDSTYSGKWGKVCQTAEFHEAVHTALSELLTNMPQDCPIPQHAADAHQQMVGARKFMEILSSLHKPETTTKPVTTPTLDYRAGV